jgi:hypothetical protein
MLYQVMSLNFFDHSVVDRPLLQVDIRTSNLPPPPAHLLRSSYILSIISTALSSAVSSKESSIWPIDLEVKLQITQLYAQTWIVGLSLGRRSISHARLYSSPGPIVVGFPGVVMPIVVFSPMVVENREKRRW